jgi:hypothetical protein
LTLSYSAVSISHPFFYDAHYFDEILHMGKTDSRYYASCPISPGAVGMPLGWLTDGAKLRFVEGGRTLIPKTEWPQRAAAGAGHLPRSSRSCLFTLSLGANCLCEGSF